MDVLVLPLNQHPWMSFAWHFSKLKIKRELDLAGAGPGNGFPEAGHRSQTLAENRIDLRSVRPVEQVEEFRHQVSRRFAPLNGKYFKVRKSMVASKVSEGFCSGLDESGNA
jgi:hypothetical protein